MNKTSPEKQVDSDYSSVKEARDNLEVILKNIAVAVIVQDRTGNLVYASASAAKMVGFRSPRALIRTPPAQIMANFRLFDEMGKEMDLKILPGRRALQGETPKEVTLRFRNLKTGKDHWSVVSATPIFDQKGQVKFAVNVFHDITSYKELEKAKTEFVSMASHELRTPLTIINGYLSMLLSGDLGNITVQTDPTTLSVLNKLKNETRRLTCLVEELLNVNRIEEGRIKLNKQPLEFAGLVGDVLAEYQPLAEQKHIRLVVDHNGHGRFQKQPLVGDRDKLKQVLVNLLDNALKFTSDGGEVAINCYPQEDVLYVEVADTGVGISPIMLPRIFEKFQQGRGSYPKENKGTGLGLFIVKAIVELHQGQILAESKVGVGSKFTICLPMGGA